MTAFQDIFFKKISYTLLALLIAACGGGGTDDDADAGTDDEAAVTPVMMVGVIVDSAVAGLHYSTASAGGTTNQDGEFNYQDGETVTFSIGDLQFPAVTATDVITPLSIFQTSDVNNTAVVNMARLLQSLDYNGDPSDGISILSAAHTAASGLTTVDFASANFDEQVADLVANSGSITTTLIDAETAVAHLEETLSVPVKFSTEYLTGKTFYVVDLDYEDDSGVERPVPIFGLDAATFHGGGTLSNTAMLPTAFPEETAQWSVNSNGELIYSSTDGTEGATNEIICGSSSSFIRIRSTDRDNASDQEVILLFFNLQDAQDYIGNNTIEAEEFVDVCSLTPEQSLVDTWFTGDFETEISVVTFHDNSTYQMATVSGDASSDTMPGDASSDDYDGVEGGTYSWNSSTGAFSASSILDSDGTGGLESQVSEGRTLVLGTDTFNFTVPEEGTGAFHRLASSATGNPLTGTWSFNRAINITFFDDLHFIASYFVNQGTLINIGAEAGSYSLDEGTGAITFNLTNDTNGDGTGLSGATFDGDTLTILGITFSKLN